MDATLAALISAIAVAVISLCGIMLTLWVSYQQQARAERLQTRRDEQAQIEIRTYRNHDRRVQVAADYIAALNRFRRSVKDLDETKSDRLGEVTSLARAADDAGALVNLYFSKDAWVASAKAVGIVRDMHEDRRQGGLKGVDAINNSDDKAKAARDELIIQLRRDLGGPEDRRTWPGLP